MNEARINHRKSKSETGTEAARSTRAAVALVYVHAGVVVIHGVAHARLHVVLSTRATVFVAAVIGIAPIQALVLLKHGNRVKGAGTLGTAMAGSFFFGIWNHFFVHGADHVAHISGGPGDCPFRSLSGSSSPQRESARSWPYNCCVRKLAERPRQSRRKADAEKERHG
jgi:hypothetical protein